MNKEQFIANYEILVSTLDDSLEYLRTQDPDTVEMAGYSLEQLLLWREEVMIYAHPYHDHPEKRITDAERQRIHACGDFLRLRAKEIKEVMGVDVLAFLNVSYA